MLNVRDGDEDAAGDDDSDDADSQGHFLKKSKVEFLK